MNELMLKMVFAILFLFSFVNPATAQISVGVDHLSDSKPSAFNAQSMVIRLAPESYISLGANHLNDNKPSALNAPVTNQQAIKVHRYECDNEQQVAVRFLSLNQVLLGMNYQQLTLTKEHKKAWRTFGIFYRPTQENAYNSFSVEKGFSERETTWVQRGQAYGILKYHNMHGTPVRTHCTVLN